MAANGYACPYTRIYRRLSADFRSSACGCCTIYARTNRNVHTCNITTDFASINADYPAIDADKRDEGSGFVPSNADGNQHRWPGGLINRSCNCVANHYCVLTPDEYASANTCPFRNSECRPDAGDVSVGFL